MNADTGTATARRPATGSKGVSRSQPLTADELRKMDAYWRACNYLFLGMLYL